MARMSNVVSVRISDEVLAMVDHLAAEYERSRAWVVQRLIEQGAKSDIEFVDFLKQGEDAFERGEFITHDQLIANIKGRQTRKQAA